MVRAPRILPTDPAILLMEGGPATIQPQHSHRPGMYDDPSAITRGTSQIEAIDLNVPPSGPGCVDCEAANAWWFHLRRCAKCGYIGCCDSSPSQHASKHSMSTGHPIIRSYEPDEDWFFDYRTGETFLGPPLQLPLYHPLSQPVPGPRGRVPQDWGRYLHL
jgi:hypothetical protein